MFQWETILVFTKTGWQISGSDKQMVPGQLGIVGSCSPTWARWPFPLPHKSQNCQHHSSSQCLCIKHRVYSGEKILEPRNKDSRMNNISFNFSSTQRVQTRSEQVFLVKQNKISLTSQKFQMASLYLLLGIQIILQDQGLVGTFYFRRKF